MTIGTDVTVIVIRDWVVAQKDAQVKLHKLLIAQSRRHDADATWGKIEAYNLMLDYLDSCKASPGEDIEKK